MIKRVLIILVVLGLFGGGYAYLELNKDHRDVESESASVLITAVDLFNAYVQDEKAANAKYLDKVVAVTGLVLEIDTDNKMIVMQTNDDFGTVNAQFENDEEMASIVEGQEVIIKGRCTGGDDLGVVLTQCSILKK